MSDAQTKHLHLELRDHIGIIWFDSPGSKVNVLSSAVANEFGALHEQVTRDERIHSVVLISRKEGCFVAGADIEEFKGFSSASEATHLSQMAQGMMNQIEASSKPFICAISGSCLGGGLELALACHYRIGTRSDATQLGLPEVLLGLIPGAGGTQRLPRLVGMRASLDMLVTGKRLRAGQAHKIGLVDAIVLPHGLVDVAVDTAKAIVAKTLKLPKRNQGTRLGLLEHLPPGRFVISLAIKRARAMVLAKTRGHFPAPERVLDVVEAGFRKGVKAGFALEAKAFGELAQTQVSKNLINLFFLQSEHRKNPFSHPKHKVQNIGIVGAGFMGSGIAQVSVQNGFEVYLNDKNQSNIASAEKQTWQHLTRLVKKHALTNFEQTQIMSRLSVQADFSHMQKCDLVIEAVFEDLALKQTLLKALEPHLSEHCIIASNTSALVIGEIAKASKRPDRIVGMHYFSPVHKMPLLEIALTPHTSKETTAAAIDVGLRQGKTILLVKDSPGFYTTRILAPFLDEAAHALLEGISGQNIDAAITAFGFPVGPVTLTHKVGLGVARQVAKELSAAFGPRISSADWAALEKNDESKFFGRAKASPSLAHQIALRFINESVYCLQEGVISTPSDGDLGAVFGLGFPAFWGGPFRYIDASGASKVLSDLHAFSEKYGQRFTPAQLLIDMAKGGKKFHKA